MNKKPALPLKVIELFAGVGGFREAMSKKRTKDYYQVVWSNQWEPRESNKDDREQTANKVYEAKFVKDGAPPHCPMDIDEATKDEKMPEIPAFDMLVGGFPCQDYSVAKPRNASKGMNGPKGVLWWNIRKILEDRLPHYVVLENVDLLIKSPSECRGRDFAIILKCLDELGYFVEWRVINAGEYGYIQRRRRIYIFAYKPGDKERAKLAKLDNFDVGILMHGRLLNHVFKISNPSKVTTYNFDPKTNSEGLKKTYVNERNQSPFKSVGMMAGGKCISADCEIVPGHRGAETLHDALLERSEVKDYDGELQRYRIRGIERVSAWAYVKGRKDEVRRKLQPLEKYVKKQLRGKAKLSSGEIRNLAKSLPRKLKMDVLIQSHEGGFKLLTREDVNSVTRIVLSESDNKFSSKAVITHKAFKKAFKIPESKLEIIERLNVVLRNRSIPAMALERLESQECKKVKSLDAAIAYLTEENTECIERLGGTAFKFERDAVSHISIAYRYQEGGMAFPDPLDKPSRTIITSEGGPSVSRFKHVICELCAERKAGHEPGQDCITEGKLRRLHPTEIEKLNGFSEEHTKACLEKKISPNKRIMLMGNAVIVDLLEDIFIELAKRAETPL
jgi:DNA (cytosine-5)-methyltransferase 1